MALVTETDFARLKSHAEAGTLTQDGWNGRRADGAEMACMMSGLVSGASSPDACATKGWPLWLTNLNTGLFDSAPDIEAAAQFSLDLAKTCMVERNYDKARDLFLISRLDEGEHSALKTLKSLDFDTTQQEAVVSEVVALLIRRANGESVDEEMQAARTAAAATADAAYTTYAAARAATYAAAAYTTYAAAPVAAAAAAAAGATYAAVRTAHLTTYAADAAYATYAAARAATYAARAAAAADAAAARATTYAAACAAARSDLITAVNKA